MQKAVAVAGVGETPYHRRGRSPDDELTLTLKAVVAACEDAGVDPREVDGFVSYAHDLNEGPSLMRALGTRRLNWSSLVWGGGGGGVAGALGLAAAAIQAGQAEIVAVYRTVSEAGLGRLSGALSSYGADELYALSGIAAPAQVCAMRAERMLARGVPASTLEGVVLADYFHAARNPRAQAYGSPITAEDYARARPIVDPFRLYDCSRENDVSVALIVTSLDRARTLRKPPVRILAAMQAGNGAALENDADYDGAGFGELAQRLWAATGLSAADVDVVQVYDNFSASAVATLIDFGFCTPETAGEVLTFQNLIAPSGRLPINTSGGLIAEGNSHGLGLAVEGVRQLRGESVNPVPDAQTCLVTGGAMAPLVSAALLTSLV